LSEPFIIKRSIVIAGHATSVSLEPEFWEALKKIAAADGLSVAALIRQIDGDLMAPSRRNLSSALRVYTLKHLQERVKKERYVYGKDEQLKK